MYKYATSVRASVVVVVLVLVLVVRLQ